MHTSACTTASFFGQLPLFASATFVYAGQGTLHDVVQTARSCKEPCLLAVMPALLCVQERTAAPGQSEQQEDEEKAALRQHIQQLQDEAARGEGAAQQAVASQATDQERLEAALQQERLQARIRQLEVTLLSSACPACMLLMQECVCTCERLKKCEMNACSSLCLVSHGTPPKGRRPVYSYSVASILPVKLYSRNRGVYSVF